MPIPEGAGPGPNHIYGASKGDDGEGGGDYRLGGEGRGGRPGGSGGGNKASPRAARAPPRAPPAGGGKGRAKRGGVFPLPSPSGADDPSITPPLDAHRRGWRRESSREPDVPRRDALEGEPMAHPPHAELELECGH